MAGGVPQGAESVERDLILPSQSMMGNSVVRLPSLGKGLAGTNSALIKEGHTSL